MKGKKRKFRTEAEEREFCSKTDSTEVIDWTKAKRIVLSNLKASVRTISLRLPESMIDGLKLIANRRDIPYQSLIEVFLAESTKSQDLIANVQSTAVSDLVFRRMLEVTAARPRRASGA